MRPSASAYERARLGLFPLSQAANWHRAPTRCPLFVVGLQHLGPTNLPCHYPYCLFGGGTFETCIAICHDPASLTAVTPACPLGPLGNMKSR
jgi:hypothetical protein